MKRAARRRLSVVAVLFALLWTQLAVAAYACPALAAKAAMPVAEAHDCESGGGAPPAIPDTDNPTLCLQHALQGDQRIDTGPGAPPTPVLGMLIGVAVVDASPQLATLVMAQARELLSRAPPPKSIVHCCFRI